MTEPRTSATNLSTQELIDELTRRGSMPRCRCGKWQTCIGVWDSDGNTVRCRGCLRSISKCMC